MTDKVFDFTVVTLSFNQVPYLERAMVSVLGQTGVKVEYIVVDPGSLDGSRDIIADHGSAVTTVFEPDDGPADGLNKGFGLANGRYLAFLNADDYFLPDALRRAKEVLDNAPDADVLLGCGWVVDDQGVSSKLVAGLPFSAWAYAYGVAEFLQQASFFRREVFERVGGFNPANRVSWDGELLLQMFLHDARFVRSEGLYAAFSVYPSSLSGGESYRRRLAEEHERLFELARHRPSRPSDEILRRIARVIKWTKHPQVLVRKLVGRRRRLIEAASI